MITTTGPMGQFQKGVRAKMIGNQTVNKIIQSERYKKNLVKPKKKNG